MKDLNKPYTEQPGKTEQPDTRIAIKQPVGAGADDHAKNPNPRANENLTREEKSEAGSSGVGSEITDGEDA